MTRIKPPEQSQNHSSDDYTNPEILQIFPKALVDENSEPRGGARRLIGKSGQVKRHHLMSEPLFLQPTLRNKRTLKCNVQLSGHTYNAASRIFREIPEKVGSPVWGFGEPKVIV